jgi:hypothetical protein
MFRTSRSARGRRRVRGSFGQWTTEDRTDGAAYDYRGWDAALLAVIDGGGCLRPTPDTTEGTDDHGGDATRTGRRTATRRSRKGGRR